MSDDTKPTDFEAELEGAAIKYAIEVHPLQAGKYGYSVPSDFKAGARWGYSKAGDKIARLEEELELTAHAAAAEAGFANEMKARAESAQKMAEELAGVLESANKTLSYMVEEYPHGQGTHLIYETIETNKRELTAYSAWKESK